MCLAPISLAFERIQLNTFSAVIASMEIVHPLMPTADVWNPEAAFAEG
jgi:hypothetical protein